MALPPTETHATGAHARTMDQEPGERIGAEGTEPAGAAPRTGEARARDLDEQLDAALACTFPASDPVGCLGTDLNCGHVTFMRHGKPIETDSAGTN